MSPIMNLQDSKQSHLATKELIMQELRRRRCRITSQRSLIVDIILKNQCSCCKEIYYQAVEQDPTIGIATVYRMLALLEEIGVIDRKNMYQIQSETLSNEKNEKVVFLGENNKVELLETNWYNEIKEHLKRKGMIQDEDISIVIKVNKPCKRGMDYYG